jgi:hypothetical protein
MEIVYIIVLVLVVFFIVNKNKKASPDLLSHKPAIFEEFTVNASAEMVYKAILQFGQSSAYKIDHIENEQYQLILNYVPKMGEQTNGTFFPIWVNSQEDGKANVCVGALDKSILSTSSEVKRALEKLLPNLKAATYSLPEQVNRSDLQQPAQKKIWDGARDISEDAYRIYLVKKYNIEKNDALGKFIANDKLFATIDEALLAVHNKEIESDIEQKTNKIDVNENKKEEISESSAGEINHGQMKVNIENDLSKLEKNGWKLVSTEDGLKVNSWKFQSQLDGQIFEFRSIKELKDFSSGFK